MEKYTKKLLIVIFILAITAFLYRGIRAYLSPISVASAVNSTNMLIGEEIKYAATIVFAKDIEIRRPDFRSALKDFEIKGEEVSEKKRFGKNTVRSKYRLTKYKTGSYSVHRVIIGYRKKNGENWKEISTPGYQVNVKSTIRGAGQRSSYITIGSDESSRKMPVELSKTYEIKEILKPKVPATKKDYIIIIAIIGTGVIFALIIGIFIKKFLSKRKPKAVPAYEIASARLKTTRHLIVYEKDKQKEIYFNLASTIKDYVKAKFYKKDIEMTSSEFITELKMIKGLDEKIKSTLIGFIHKCDGVKFSTRLPNKEDEEPDYRLVKDFIEKTEEHGEGS